MTDIARSRILEARDAWRLAEQAYTEELNRYVSAGWAADGPAVPPEKVLGGRSYGELMRLRRSADDARREFERRCGT